MQRICTKCGSENIHRSRLRKGERTITRFFYRPLHCHECGARYWVPYRKAYITMAAVLFCSLLAYFIWDSILMPSQNVTRLQRIESQKATGNTDMTSQDDPELDLVLNNPMPAVTSKEIEASFETAINDQETEFRADNRHFVVQLYSEKAQKGDANAQYQLGILYINGNGTIQDFEEAAKWFQFAAENNHALAQYELGRIYQAGLGVDANPEKSYIWLNLAAAAGVEEAVAARNKVMRSLNAEQLIQAQRASREWLKNRKKDDMPD